MLSTLRKARFVDTSAPQAEWRQIHRIADAAYPGVFAQVFKTLRQLKVPIEKVTALVSQGKTTEALELVNFEDQQRAFLNRVQPLLWRNVYLKARRLARRNLKHNGYLRKAAVDPDDFRAVSPHAVAWAERAGADIVGITKETREAVSTAVSRAFREGIPPRNLARMIRDVVGVTRTQSAALSVLRAKLSATGMAAGRVSERVEAARLSALRWRAENIARTEVMTAANFGQIDAWAEAKREGLLDSRLMKEWITTPDDRLCPVCEPLEGEQRQLDQSFSVGVLAPPAHPSCRCAQGLSFPAERAEGVLAEEPPSDSKSPIAVGEIVERRELGGGVNDSYVVTLRSADGTTAEAVFKPVSGEKFKDGRLFIRPSITNQKLTLAEREALAYRVDRMLGTNLVPETVFREGGSLQRFIPDAQTNIMRDAPLTQEYRERFALLDFVLGNADRSPANFIFTGDTIYAIDHGYTFPAKGKHFFGGTEDVFGLRTFVSEPVTGFDDKDWWRGWAEERQRAAAERLSRFDWKQFAADSGMSKDEQEAFLSRIGAAETLLSQGRFSEVFNKYWGYGLPEAEQLLLSVL